MNYNVSLMGFFKRINYGKEVERHIFESLVNCGWVLEPATTTEDIHFKIDAFKVQEDGTRLPLQIKYRAKGNDIIFEVHRFKPNETEIVSFNGRDYKSEAKLYIGLKSSGKEILVASIDRLRADSIEATNILLRSKKNKIGFYKNKKRVGDVRVSTDPFSGVKKVLYYGFYEYYTVEKIILDTPLIIPFNK